MFLPLQVETSCKRLSEKVRHTESEDRTPCRTHIFLSLVSVAHILAPFTFTRTRVWPKT